MGQQGARPMIARFERTSPCSPPAPAPRGRPRNSLFGAEQDAASHGSGPGKSLFGRE
jgi:hypothetical protein